MPVILPSRGKLFIREQKKRLRKEMVCVLSLSRRSETGHRTTHVRRLLVLTWFPTEFQQESFRRQRTLSTEFVTRHADHRDDCDNVTRSKRGGSINFRATDRAAVPTADGCTVRIRTLATLIGSCTGPRDEFLLDKRLRRRVRCSKFSPYASYSLVSNRIFVLFIFRPILVIHFKSITVVA